MDIDVNAVKKIPVEFNTKRKGKIVLNLRPNVTIVQVINKAMYHCIRSYTIDENEIRAKQKIQNIPPSCR
jgi:hypothetical protein